MRGTVLRTLNAPALWAAVLFLASLGFYSLYYNRGMLLTDEGSLVHAAQRIAGGEVPYRDFYHFYAPGSFYLLAGLFRIFGESFLLSRIMWVVVRAAIVALMFLAGCRFMPKRFALLPALVTLLVPGPWFKSFYAFSAVGCLWATLRYLERATLARLAAASACVAAAALLRQDVGVEAGLVLAAAAFLNGRVRDNGARSWRRAFGHAAFSLLVSGVLLLPVVLYFAAEHALRPMMDQLFGLAPSYTMSKWWVVGVKMSAESYPLFEKVIFALPPLFVLCGFVVLAVRWWRGGLTRLNLKLAVLLVLAAGTLLPAYLPMALIRLYQAVPVTWIATGWLLYGLCSALERPASGLPPVRRAVLVQAPLYAAAAALCAAFVVYAMSLRGARLSSSVYTGTITASLRDDTPFVFRGETVYLSERKGRQLQRLVRYVRRHAKPREPILVFPNQSLLYYLCDRPNKTRFIGTFTLKYPLEAQDPEIERQWLPEIRRVRPPCVLVHQKFLRTREKGRSFRKAMERYYEPDTEIGGFVLMLRTSGERHD